ncbi:MAG: HD domain-containing protein [Sphaerochaeta sp.]|jgi:HD superfamily phosphohydrolase
MATLLPLYTPSQLAYYLAMTSLLNTLITQESHVVRDPLWKDIHLSDSLYQMYRSKAMQKLGRIKQLGPTFLLYPGAVHTRLNHSLGVYHIGRQILLNLLKKIENSLFSIEGVNAYLCALLLHDIGHFPYAHSLKDVIADDHEAIGAQIIENDQELRSLIKACNTTTELVCAIIDEARPAVSEEISLYRSILSGALDPDKLDYLNRDAFFCGVPYGMQDVSYITGKLQVCDGRLALEEEAIASVEHLLFSKYLMYRNVYWHPRTRSATAMIKKAVVGSLSDGHLREDELFNLDDEEFTHLAKEKRLATLPLFEAVHNNQIYRCVYEESWEAEKVPTPFERHQREELLCSKYGLAPYSLIIDIPEPIGFEASMPIVDAQGRAVNGELASHLFSGGVGQAFTKRLRKFRIFSPVSLTQEIIDSALES